MAKMRSVAMVEEWIEQLEAEGHLDPTCPTCIKVFYPHMRAHDEFPFAPHHKASARCESGRRPHCSCGTCF
jgi:hypothetical protein